MAFEHDSRVLDFVEVAPLEAPPEKGMEEVWKTSEKKKKVVGQHDLTHSNVWSGRLDLNQRPLRPERSALPD
jgi:hypothetical protein